MNSDLRRTRRYNEFIAVSVFTKNEKNRNIHIGPYTARLINISQYGVCLLMSLGVLDSYEVYRSTYRDQGMYLEIKGSIPPDIAVFNLSGRPVWMEPFVLDDLRAFKMGIEFNSPISSTQSDNIIANLTTEQVG